MDDVPWVDLPTSLPSRTLTVEGTGDLPDGVVFVRLIVLLKEQLVELDEGSWVAC